LTVSSDYYFYNLGFLFSAQESKYGATPIQNVGHEFGLGTSTGVDLAGEAIGRIDSQAERQKLHAANPTGFPNTKWYAGDNIEMAFGQGGTVVTPIQMATAYSTLLNGGTRYAPQVVAGTVSANGTAVNEFQPKVTGHVALNDSITGPIIDGLLGVVNDPKGTAFGTFQQYARYDQRAFVVGGKTGTASNAPGLEPNSWFVGFGGGRNPDYVVVCVIDQGGYGANAAAPVVAQIFNYLATNPVGPIVWPSASNPPSNAAPGTNLPAGTVLPAAPTTTTPQG
jgi:penicillin-binding protein 2